MTTWHAPADALVRFAHAPEDLDDSMAASIEQHLVACDECRTVVAGATDDVLVARSWAEVADAIDEPNRWIAERTLARLGVPANMSRLVGATPQLRLAWLATTLVLAAAAVAIGRDADSDSLYLAVAPLMPLGSVLLAFLPTEEPGGEAAVATPVYGAGLLLRRVVAVLVPTFAILVIAGLAPDRTAEGALWVLPGLALALGGLALSTVTRASVATTILAVLWASLVIAAWTIDGRHAAVADTAVFTTWGQCASAGIALVAAAWIYVRRDSFSTMEVTW